MSSAARLRAVVFDLDGLMFNTEELYDEVSDTLLRRRGQVYTPDLKFQLLGRPARVGWKMMIDAHGLDATVDQLQAEADEIFADILAVRLRPMPGLETLLQALEAVPLPKAIATSSGRQYVNTVLAQFAYAPRFQFVLTEEDVRQGKPAPEVYHAAAARFGLAPAELMVLEDSEHGCRAGVAAGAFTVAVPDGCSPRQGFSGAALVVDSLEDERIYQALGLSPPR